MYQVIIPKSVAKQKNKLPEKTQQKINRLLIELSNQPLLGKQLAGQLANYRSLRVWPYRIIHRVDHKLKIILIVSISHRQGVYI